MDVGGGPDLTVTVTFDGDPHRQVFTVGGGTYDTVAVTVAGQPQPQLADDDTLLAYLQGLLGPTPFSSVS